MNFNFFYRILKDTGFYFVSFAPIALAVDHAVLSVAYVQGKSMAPTLNAGPLGPTKGQIGPNSRAQGPSSHSVGFRTTPASYVDDNEIIMVRKLMYHPARGDVVVLESPGNAGERAVKRLVALEGDVILYLNPTHSLSLLSLSREMERQREVEERAKQDKEIEEKFALKMRDAEDVGEVMEEMNEYFRKREERDRRAWMGGQDIGRELKGILEGEKESITINTTAPTETTSTDKPDANPPTEIPQPIPNKFLQKSILFEDVELQVVRIPPGHCWVEGDNPEVSRDSKEYGPIPMAMIKGKVEAVIWPPRLAGFIRPHFGTTEIICISFFSLSLSLLRVYIKEEILVLKIQIILVL